VTAPVPKRTVVEAMLDVMGDVQAIEKKDRNQEQGFWFRGIDAVMNDIGPVLRKHRVLLLPEALWLRTERYRTTRGTGMKCAEVHMRFTAYGPAGDEKTGSTFGEAADSGDKAVSKAQSVALRVFLLQGLSIPTRQPDPDASSHERSPEQPDARAALEELTELFRWRAGGDQDVFDQLHADAVHRFASEHDGRDIRDCLDASQIQALTKQYQDSWAAAAPADS
jgi:hypothetical protein